jgi:hypothetical protein
MKHIAIFYTHNQLSENVLRKSLMNFSDLLNNRSLPLKTTGVVISVVPVKAVYDVEGENIRNLIAPDHMINKKHLSIVEKVLYVLDLYPSDYVSLHEHDALYPKEYLSIIQNVFISNGTSRKYFDYLAYNNIVGVCRAGYQSRIVKDHPLSTLSFPSEILTDVLRHKRSECKLGQWCFLEPGYGGSYGAHYRLGQIGEGEVPPIVHINMNLTGQNHHLTNHYDTYSAPQSNDLMYWPGDLSTIFD